MRARNFYRRKNHEHQGKSQDEAHNVRAPSGPCLPPRLDLTWLPATRSKTAAGSKWDEEVDGSFGVLDLKALLSESCDIATEHQRLEEVNLLQRPTVPHEEAGNSRSSDGLGEGLII